MTAWEDRLRATHAAATAAAELERQAIRDAKADGATPVAIAAAIGVKNRQRIYDVLTAAEHGEIPNPPLTAVAYLRGAGIHDEAWTMMERAVRARGFRTTHDRLSAWHLCRGGTPVVLVDFSADLRGEHDGWNDEEGGGYVGEARFTRVGLTRAKYRDGPWGQEQLLVLVNGGDRYEPWDGAGHLDAALTARLAVEALYAGKGDIPVPAGHGQLQALPGAAARVTCGWRAGAALAAPRAPAAPAGPRRSHRGHGGCRRAVTSGRPAARCSVPPSGTTTVPAAAVARRASRRAGG